MPNWRRIHFPSQDRRPRSLGAQETKEKCGPTACHQGALRVATPSTLCQKRPGSQTPELKGPLGLMRLEARERARFLPQGHPTNPLWLMGLLVWDTRYRVLGADSESLGTRLRRHVASFLQGTQSGDAAGSQLWHRLRLPTGNMCPQVDAGEPLLLRVSVFLHLVIKSKSSQSENKSQPPLCST